VAEHRKAPCAINDDLTDQSDIDSLIYTPHNLRALARLISLTLTYEFTHFRPTDIHRLSSNRLTVIIIYVSLCMCPTTW